MTIELSRLQPYQTSMELSLKKGSRSQASKQACHKQLEI